MVPGSVSRSKAVNSDRAVHGGSMWKLAETADAGNRLLHCREKRIDFEVGEDSNCLAHYSPPARLVLRLRLLTATSSSEVTRTSHLQAPWNESSHGASNASSSAPPVQ